MAFAPSLASVAASRSPGMGGLPNVTGVYDAGGSILSPFNIPDPEIGLSTGASIESMADGTSRGIGPKPSLGFGGRIMQMLPQLQQMFQQQQEQQGLPPVQAPGLLMPNAPVGQFQLQPLTAIPGLFGGMGR